MKKLLLSTVLLLSTNVFAIEKIDYIESLSFEDPYIKGINCFLTLSNFSSENNFLNIYCYKSSNKIDESHVQSKHNVFNNSDSLISYFFKIDRLYDYNNNSLVYVAYTKNTFKYNYHRISVVSL